MIEQKYLIEGMTCGSCAMRIENKVAEMSKVLDTYVDFGTKTLTVKSEEGIDFDELKTTVGSVGNYTIAVKDDESSDGEESDSEESKKN